MQKKNTKINSKGRLAKGIRDDEPKIGQEQSLNINNSKICIITWIYPPPSNSGKWRFIGIPY